MKSKKKDEENHDDDNSDDSNSADSNNSDDESEDSTQDDSKNANGKNAQSPGKKKGKATLIMDISDCQYEIVKWVGKNTFGWKITTDPESEWDIRWTDNAVQPEFLARMQEHQRINHFPGMYALARKNHLGRNLMRMKKLFPEEYKFFPPTWLLPTEFNEFRREFEKKSNDKIFIIKPEALSQGKGIFLTKSIDNIESDQHFVAQRYISKPYLIEGLKFDMRIYVLLAGCDPLRIYVYNDGLGRFATETYVEPNDENLDNVCMHLTNYAINKENPNFVFNEDAGVDDVGHKRSLKAVLRQLGDEGHDIPALWSEIKKIIIKTLIAAQPILAHSYKSCHPDEHYNNMCFEILGFDIMLDHKMKPWLIEVNHTPSFTTDTPLDRSIKRGAIEDALKLMNVTVKQKMKVKNKKRAELQQRVLTGKKIRLTPEEKAAVIEQAQKERNEYESANCGGFERIYPFEDPMKQPENYDELLKGSLKLFEEWTGTSIRRNTKKVTDPSKPLPFVFGNTSKLSQNVSNKFNYQYDPNKPKMPYKPPPNPLRKDMIEPKEPISALDQLQSPMNILEQIQQEDREFIEHVAAIGKDIDIRGEDEVLPEDATPQLKPIEKSAPLTGPDRVSPARAQFRIRPYFYSQKDQTTPNRNMMIDASVEDKKLQNISNAGQIDPYIAKKNELQRKVPIKLNSGIIGEFNDQNWFTVNQIQQDPRAFLKKNESVEKINYKKSYTQAYTQAYNQAYNQAANQPNYQQQIIQKPQVNKNFITPKLMEINIPLPSRQEEAANRLGFGLIIQGSNAIVNRPTNKYSRDSNQLTHKPQLNELGNYRMQNLFNNQTQKYF